MKLWPIVLSFVVTAPALVAQECRDDYRVLTFPRGTTMYDKTLVHGALRGSDALIFGSEISHPNIDTVERMADSGGIGAVIIDGPLDRPREVTNLVNALATSPTALWLRVRDVDDPRLKQNLDAGAFGAILRDPRDAADVRNLFQRLYHRPLGDRRVGPSKVNGFLDVPDFHQLGRMEKELTPLVLGGIEIGQPSSLGTLDNLSDLAAHGLRLVVLDRQSLAKAWGLEAGSADFAARLAPWEEKLRASGVPFGTTVETRAEALALAPRGYRYFTLGSDLHAIRKAFDRFADRPRNPAIEFASDGPKVGPGAPTMREVIRRGKMLHASFLMTPDVAAAKELARHSESLWIDSEHGPFSPDDVVKLIGELKGLTRVIVRVPQSWNPNIGRYLDAGAQGIVAPNMGSAAEAAAFVKAVKANHPEALAIPIIETRDGFANRNEIARTPGIDVVHIGPYDLADSLGIARGSKEHDEAIAEIERAATDAGVPLGGLAGTRTVSDKKFGQGYRFLTIVSDQEAYAQYFKEQFPRDVHLSIVGGPDGQGYYNHPFVVRPETERIWKEDGDGTKVALFHGGPNLSIQIAVKQGLALVDGKSVAHSHPQGQLTYIVKGRAYLRDGDRKIPIQAGDFVYIPPDVVHAFEDIGGQETFVWMDVFTHNRYTGRPDPKATKETRIPIQP